MSTLKVGEIKHENFTGTTQLKLDNSGRLLLGTTTEGVGGADNFTIAGSGDSGMTIRSGTSSTGGLYFSDGTSGADEYRGVISYNQASNYMRFYTDASERMRIDSSGRLLLGTTSNTSTGVGSSKLQISGTGADTAGLNLIRTSNDGGGAYLQFTKNRGGATQSGDNCGSIAWMGHDGTDVNSYLATIKVEAGATASSNTMRGDIIFETADGGSVTSERMRIDSSGLVGIGTTSPTRTISAHVSDSGANYIHLTNTGTGAGDANGTFIGIDAAEGALIWNQEDNYVRFGTNNAERMRINSDGDVLIGRTSTIDTSEVLGIKGPSGDNCTFGVTCNGTTQAGIIAFNDDDANFKGRVQYNHNGDSMVFHTASTERVRIDNEGMAKVCSESHALGVSTTASSGTNKYCFRGHHSGTNGSPASGTLSFTVWSNGNVENLNNSYGQISDETLKQDIVDASSQWNDIKNITVRKFRFKDNPTGNLQIGVVAQEVEKVSAGLVYETGDVGKEVKAVKYSVLHMKAVKALQEAQVRIETLETKVAALEAK